MNQYAASTTVDVGRTQAELRTLLIKRGAEQVGIFEDIVQKKAGLIFSYKGLKIRLSLPLPEIKGFEFTPTGKWRAEEAQKREYEQAVRSRWRQLLLLLKAKFVAIDTGITTIEREFLPDLMLPDGQTVESYFVPQIARIYENGQMPPLLPWLEEKK